MPDEGEGQVVASDAPAGVFTIEADDARLGAAVTAVAEPVAEAVVDEAPLVAAPEPAPTPALDLSTREGIRKAAEAFPELRGWREEGFEAGKQKQKADSARDLGTAQAVQTYHEWLTGEIARGGDPVELGKQTPQYVKANDDANRVGLYGRLLEGAIALLGPTEAEPLKALQASFDGSPDQLEAVAQAALNAATARAAATAVTGLKLADVPKDAPLYAELEAWKEEQLAAELKARDITAADSTRATRDAPALPTGEPAAPPAVDNPQTAEEWQVAYGYGRKSHTEFKEAMGRLGVKVRA